MTGRDRFGLGISNHRPAREVAAGVRQAEDLGAEVAFVSEDVNGRDAFELCALAALQTERIRLSTGVVNPFTRNPTSLAMAVGTLDEISDGRAMLGLGTSSPSLIQEQMGIRSEGSVGVMREATEIVRALLAGESVTYTGRRFSYKEARLEVRPVQPRIPIFYAAMGPMTLRLAGRTADGVLLNVGASVEYVRWAVAEVAAGAREAGRDPAEVTIAAWLTVYITQDVAAGSWRARQWLATMLSIPRQGELLLERTGLDTAILPDIRERVRGYPHSGDPADAARFVPPQVAERLTLIGSASRVRERLEEYRAAGVALPVVGLSTLRQLFKA